MAGAPDYSDLEVGRRPEKPHEPHSTLQVNNPNPSLFDSEKQLPEVSKEPYSTLQVNRAEDTSKQIARPFHPYDASLEKVEYASDISSSPTKSEAEPPRRILGLRRKTFWIVLLLSIVILAAIIGGAVGGTVGRRNSNTSSSQGNNLGESVTAGPPVPSASKLLESTTLSSAAWNDTQDILQQRVYIQSTNNSIWELSWNSSVNAWFTSSESLAVAKPGSPLAAAVAYKGRTNQLNLFYIDVSGQLMQMNTTDYNIWDTNPVKAETGAVIKPANDSSLAATWYSYPPCPDCSYNVFVAYQDSASGKFEIVNSSMSGDTQYITVPGKPVSGSSSTFNLQWRSNNMANLRLGYQLEDGQIASAFWNGTIATWKPYETAKETATYSRTAILAPLASFPFGAGAPTEVPAFLFVLSVGANNGVAVDWWDNSNPGARTTGWGTTQSPAVMQRVRALSPIAANAAGRVFAFGDGDGDGDGDEGQGRGARVVKEFAVHADGRTWDEVGDVTGS